MRCWVEVGVGVVLAVLAPPCWTGSPLLAPERTPPLRRTTGQAGGAARPRAAHSSGKNRAPVCDHR
jgi:hypothetical protein